MPSDLPFDGLTFMRSFSGDATRVYDGLDGFTEKFRPDQVMLAKTKTISRLVEVGRWAGQWQREFEEIQRQMTFHQPLMRVIELHLDELEQSTGIMLQHHKGLTSISDMETLIWKVQAEMNKILDCTTRTYRYFELLNASSKSKSLQGFRG